MESLGLLLYNTEKLVTATGRSKTDIHQRKVHYTDNKEEYYTLGSDNTYDE